MSSCVMLALALLLPGLPKSPRTNALAFLTKVTQRYVDAKSYHIEATLERTSSNALSRDWQKYLLKAIVAPDGRYRYEGQSDNGSAAFISNGTKQWIYHPDVHEYTESAVLGGKPAEHRVYMQEEIAVMEAQELIGRIRTLATPLKSASFLPDETIVVGGRSIDCRVVHFTNADFKFPTPRMKEETVWIDKVRNVIVKTVSHSDSFTIIPDENFRIPTKMVETAVYTVMKLGSPEPERSFTFSPPPNSKLLASFPTPSIGVPWPASEFVGKLAPDIHLRRDGKVIPLSSYRGKPVFIDFWARWCGPCVELTPGLKKLYAETHDKGLVWIGIDKDKDAGKMEAYVRREHIPWPNYNDKDGSISKAFECNAIPLGVLINPSGKVTFYVTGYPLAGLRAAIAKLGPRFRNAVMKSKNAGADVAKP